MADYVIRVEASTEDAENKLKRVEKHTKSIDKNININVNTGAIDKAVSALGNLAKVTASTAKTALDLSRALNVGPGAVLNDIEDLFRRVTGAGEKTVSVFSALAQSTPTRILGTAFDAATGSALQFSKTVANIGYEIFGLTQSVTILQNAFGGFFNETIGREIRLQEALLRTKTTLISTADVLQNGKRIDDPVKALQALDGPINDTVDNIRRRSLEIAGTTSDAIIQTFGVVASQIGGLGGTLKDAENLAISFAGALGTIGMSDPMLATQEIRSIMTGNIDQNSVLARMLGINSAEIQKAKQSSEGLVAYLQKRLEGFTAGQKMAARGFAGIVSNIQEVREEISRSFGKELLAPLLESLTTTYLSLIKIFETLKQIGSNAGRTVANVVNIFKASTASAPILQNVSLGPAATQVEALTDQLATVVASKLREIQPLITRLVNEVLEGIARVTQGLGALLQGFAYFKFEELKVVATQFANIATILNNTLVPALQAMLNLYGQLLQLPIVNYFAQVGVAQEALEKMGVLSVVRLVATWKFYQESINTFIGWLKTAFETMKSIFDGAIAGISGAFEGLGTFIKTLGETIVTYAEVIANKIFIAFFNLMGKLGIAFIKIGSELQVMLAKINPAFGQIGVAIAGVGKSLLKLSRNIDQVQNDFAELRVGVLEDLSAIDAKLKNVGNNIKTWGSTIGTKIGAGLKGLAKNIFNIAKEFLKFQLVLMVAEKATAIVTDMFGRMQRAQERLKATKDVENALARVAKGYEKIGDTITEAGQKQKDLDAQILKTNYDANIAELQALKNKQKNLLEDQAQPGIQSLPELGRAFNPELEDVATVINKEIAEVPKALQKLYEEAEKAKEPLAALLTLAYAPGAPVFPLIRIYEYLESIGSTKTSVQALAKEFVSLGNGLKTLAVLAISPTLPLTSVLTLTKKIGATQPIINALGRAFDGLGAKIANAAKNYVGFKNLFNIGGSMLFGLPILGDALAGLKGLLGKVDDETRTRIQSEIDKLEAQNAAIVQATRDDQQRENVALAAKQRTAALKELKQLEQQIDGEIFQARQQAAAKEIEQVNRAGQLRINKILEAKKLAINSGNEEADNAMKNFEEYLAEKEKRELNLEADRKKFQLEMANIEQTIGNYRIALEEKLAAIRQRAAIPPEQPGAAPSDGTGGFLVGSTGRSSGDHLHISNPKGDKNAVLEEAFRIIKEWQKQGVAYIQLSNAKIDVKNTINDAALRRALRAEQNVHGQRSGGGAIDIAVPAGTRVPARVSAARYSGDAGYMATSLDTGNLFMHGLPTSTASGSPGAAPASTGAASNNAMANVAGYLKRLSYLESELKNVPNKDGSGAMGYFQTMDALHKEAARASGGLSTRSSDYNESADATLAWIKTFKPKAFEYMQKGMFDAADRILAPVWSALPGGKQPQNAQKQKEARRYLPGGDRAGNEPGLYDGPPDQTDANLKAREAELATLRRNTARMGAQDIALTQEINKFELAQQRQEIFKALTLKRPTEQLNRDKAQLDYQMESLAIRPIGMTDPREIQLSESIVGQARAEFAKSAALIQTLNTRIADTTKGMGDLQKANKTNTSEYKNQADQLNEYKLYLAEVIKATTANANSLIAEGKERFTLLNKLKQFEYLQDITSRRSAILPSFQNESLKTTIDLAKLYNGNDITGSRQIEAEASIAAELLRIDQQQIPLNEELIKQLRALASETRTNAENLAKMDLAAQEFAKGVARAREAASAIAQGYKGFLTSIITGGNPIQALNQMLEGIAGRFLDMALEYAFEPVQRTFEEIFKKNSKLADPKEELTRQNNEKLAALQASNENKVVPALDNLVTALNKFATDFAALIGEIKAPALPGTSVDKALDDKQLPGTTTALPAGTPSNPVSVSVVNSAPPVPPTPLPGAPASPALTDTSAFFTGGFDLAAAFPAINPTLFTSFETGLSDAAANLTTWTTGLVTTQTGLGDLGLSTTSLSQTLNSTNTAAQQAPSFLQKMGGAIQGVTGALAGVAAGVAGAQQMSKGGTYNTLMGLAGIFSGIGAVLAPFSPMGALGGLFRAKGGPVDGGKPYIVGEKGPELFVPSESGKIVPHHATQSEVDKLTAQSSKALAPIKNVNNIKSVTNEINKKFSTTAQATTTNSTTNANRSNLTQLFMTANTKNSTNTANNQENNQSTISSAISNQLANVRNSLLNFGDQTKTNLNNTFNKNSNESRLEAIKNIFSNNLATTTNNYSDLFRAKGGPVSANRPYIVGEQGPELFMPNSDGEIVPNNRMDAAFEDTRRSLGEARKRRQDTRERTAMDQMTQPQGPINVAYESRVINNVEYVTTEQMQKATAQAAERGRALAYQGMQNSVRVRRRLGL